nr:hypothetical protein [Tanacetum cinerariifolium]GFA29955.1 hypothetical protein [Tanacetum cinerariifolium]
ANDKTGLDYNSQMNKSDLNDVYVNESQVIGNSLIDSHESDEEDNQVNDRFKKSEGYHAVPPPYTENYMPPRADLFFAGLDDSVFKFEISETVTSVNETKTSTSKTNSEDENVVEKTEVKKTVKPSLEKIEFVNVRNTTLENESKAENQSGNQLINTARPKAVINAVRTNRVNDVKALVCWVWRPIKPNCASITLKRYDYVDGISGIKLEDSVRLNSPEDKKMKTKLMLIEDKTWRLMSTLMLIEDFLYKMKTNLMLIEDINDGQ